MTKPSFGSQYASHLCRNTPPICIALVFGKHRWLRSPACYTSGKIKEHKHSMFVSPGIVLWGGVLQCEGVGIKKFSSCKPHENQPCCWDVPGTLLGYPGPPGFVCKSVCVCVREEFVLISWPLAQLKIEAELTPWISLIYSLPAVGAGRGKKSGRVEGRGL